MKNTNKKIIKKQRTKIGANGEKIIVKTTIVRTTVGNVNNKLSNKKNVKKQVKRVKSIPTKVEEGFAVKVLAAVNRERQKQKLTALARSSSLNRAAVLHAKDMIKHKYFSHQGKAGSTPKQRIIAANYKGRIFGENIAMGQRTAVEVVKSWMDSPGHRANILQKKYKYMGIACILGNNSLYWVQTFGG